MTVYSPYDDFMHRTVDQIEGLWMKLEYIAGLRQKDGEYDHWGMARVFGPTASQKAIEQAHRAIMQALLRMPLRDLLEDMSKAAAAQGRAVGDYAAELNARLERVMPKQMGGGSGRHFSSVLMALASLAEACRPTHTVATRRVS